MSPRIVSLIAAIIIVGFTTDALAQMPRMPNSPTTSDKKKGIAEKAPVDAGALPTTPVLPPPTSKEKRFEHFSLNGYFRFRSDMLRNFHLGFNDDPVLGGAPFKQPLSCKSASAPACDDSIYTSNMKLRLDPQIKIGENSSIHMQIDVLDNVVMGAHPEGTFGSGVSAPPNIPFSAFSPSQVAPEQGKNWNTDSIMVKRAWADI